MVRFIINIFTNAIGQLYHLHSNMVRFIIAFTLALEGISASFTFQYG